MQTDEPPHLGARRRGPLHDDVGFGTTQRMLYHHDSRVDQAAPLGLVQRQWKERLGDDEDGGDAPALQLDEVVDTPRRASASVTTPGEDQRTQFRGPIEHIGRTRDLCSVLGVDIDNISADVLGQVGSQFADEQPCVHLAVVHHTDAQPRLGQGDGQCRAPTQPAPRSIRSI